MWWSALRVIEPDQSAPRCSLAHQAKANPATVRATQLHAAAQGKVQRGVVQAGGRGRLNRRICGHSALGGACDAVKNRRATPTTVTAR